MRWHDLEDNHMTSMILMPVTHVEIDVRIDCNVILFRSVKHKKEKGETVNTFTATVNQAHSRYVLTRPVTTLISQRLPFCTCWDMGQCQLSWTASPFRRFCRRSAVWSSLKQWRYPSDVMCLGHNHKSCWLCPHWYHMNFLNSGYMEVSLCCHGGTPKSI